MRKPTKRERAEQRRIRELQKRVPPVRPNTPQVQAASRLMQARDPAWDSVWDYVKYLDSRILNLQKILEHPYSEALFNVASELQAGMKRIREELLVDREYRPATPKELYTATSYDHKFL